MKENKILLVTGASSDMGCDLIGRVADGYETVIAHYFHWNENLEKLKEKLGDKLVGMQADFSDEESTRRFAAAVKAQYPVIDHFVHFPARRISHKKFAKTSWQDFENEIQISLRSFVEVAKAVMPAMAKQKYGKVLVMLSSCTQGTAPKYLSAYTSIKYAMLGLVKSLASEYADKKITVNGISPEMTETKFLADVASLIAENNAMTSPIGRNLTLDDVTPMAAFLLTDAADAITGQNFAITGGR